MNEWDFNNSLTAKLFRSEIKRIIQEENQILRYDKKYSAVVASTPSGGYCDIYLNTLGATPLIPNVKIRNGLYLDLDEEVYVTAINGSLNNLFIDFSKRFLSSVLGTIYGVSNQITVTENGDGTVTLSLPQDINTTSNPTFNNITGTGLVKGATGHFGGVTDHSEFESDGTLKFNGNATVYKDLQFPISSGKIPLASTPIWEEFTLNTNEYSFGIDNYIDLESKEIFHSWEISSTPTIHLHVTSKSANNSGFNQYAKFNIWVAYNQPGTAWSEISFTSELTIPDGTTGLESFYLSIGDLDLSGYGLETQIKIRVKRIAATSGDEYPENIFVNQVGIHLENDTCGSREETNK